MSEVACVAISYYKATKKKKGLSLLFFVVLRLKSELERVGSRIVNGN